MVLDCCCVDVTTVVVGGVVVVVGLVGFQMDKGRMEDCVVVVMLLDRFCTDVGVGAIVVLELSVVPLPLVTATDVVRRSGPCAD